MDLFGIDFVETFMNLVTNFFAWLTGVIGDFLGVEDEV
jgi:hypothetical protein